MKFNIRNLLPQSKTEYVLAGLYLLFFVGDIASTLIHGSLVSQLEANPIYLATKSLIPTIIANLLILMGLIFVYRRFGINMRWWITTFIVWLSFIRIVVILNNIMAYINPPTQEQAAAVSQALQTDYTAVMYPFILVIIFYFFIPLMLSLISFWIYRLDHTIQKKDKIKRNPDNGVKNLSSKHGYNSEQQCTDNSNDN